MTIDLRKTNANLAQLAVRKAGLDGDLNLDAIIQAAGKSLEVEERLRIKDLQLWEEYEVHGNPALEAVDSALWICEDAGCRRAMGFCRELGCTEKEIKDCFVEEGGKL